MSHGNAKKIWVILTRATMAVTLSVSGSAEDAGTRSSAARARVGIQGGRYLPGGWPDVGLGDRSGLGVELHRRRPKPADQTFHMRGTS